MSLSGSTLTVNVDGHSDSVSLSGLTPLSGLINFYSNFEGPSVSYSIGNKTTTTRYVSSVSWRNTETHSSGNVSIVSVAFSSGGYTTEEVATGSLSISSSSIINGFIDSYSLQGTGTITLYGAIATGDTHGSVPLHGGTSFVNRYSIMTLNISNGIISDASISNAYLRTSVYSSFAIAIGNMSVS